MPIPFKGASNICGFLWGLSGAAMVYVSPLGGLTYIAHVLYWFYRIKLEYTNHALAGVMMIIAGFFFQGEFLYIHRFDLLLVFLAYLITGAIQTYFKENYPRTKKFWRLRLRIYLIPIAYSVYHSSLDPIIATGFGMLACEIVTNYYKKFAADVRYGH